MPYRRAFVFLSMFSVGFLLSLFRHVSADEWQPVSPEELKMTSVPEAPGAPAVILYRQVDRDDSGRVPHEYNYVRIKILTDEGRKYADVEIPFFVGGPEHPRAALAVDSNGRPVKVAAAAPVTPSRGNGPQPKISRGFRAISSTTDMSRKRNGVRESPAPRSTAMTKNNPPMKGSARKMMRTIPKPLPV